jgi:hypothetical protein
VWRPTNRLRNKGLYMGIAIAQSEVLPEVWQTTCPLVKRLWPFGFHLEDREHTLVQLHMCICDAGFIRRRTGQKGRTSGLGGHKGTRSLDTCLPRSGNGEFVVE